MAFNQPDITPAAAEAIYRVLDAAPGKRLRQESLIARIVPDHSANGTKVIGDTLRELRGVGVVVEEGESLRVYEPANATRPSDVMRQTVLAAVMSHADDAELWTERVADEEGERLRLTGARDLLRALAWLLVLPSTDCAWAFQGTRSIQQEQEDRLPFQLIRNPERWPPFVRWSTYLGFASSYAANTLVPDPTTAIVGELERLLRGRGVQPLEAVVEQLAVTFPVLDNGEVQRVLRTHYDVVWDADLSPALSLALLRLHARGWIAFDEGLGDASKLRLANDQGAYHAVRWTKDAR